jgi:hypothetical protein
VTRPLLAPMLAPTKRRHDDVTVASPHTEQGERVSARMPPSPRSDHRSVRPRLGDDASSPWARCASVLRIALEAMPYGDAPPAEVSNGKVTGGLSVGQLLNWGDKLQAGDSPKPSEEVLLRWSSHTLNTLAAANRSRTAVALRAVADSIEASPPDACLLPPRLLLRYGPSALRHQLLAIPDAAAGDDLGNLVGWMRVAAGVYDVADRAAGWQRILAGLGATPAAPAPPDAPDGGVGAPQEAAAATPPPPGPREGCFSAKGRAVRDPDAPPLSLPALSEAAALADEVTGSPPTSPHTPPPHTPHTPPPSPDQQQGHLRDASSPSAAQLLKMVAAPGLVAEVHTSLHDGPAVAGGAEARHWRVCARVRCVSREARTVSRILVAEQVRHAVRHVVRHVVRCRVPCTVQYVEWHILAVPSLPSLHARCTFSAPAGAPRRLRVAASGGVEEAGAWHLERRRVRRRVRCCHWRRCHRRRGRQLRHDPRPAVHARRGL